MLGSQTRCKHGLDTGHWGVLTRAAVEARTMKISTKGLTTCVLRDMFFWQQNTRHMATRFLHATSNSGVPPHQ